MATNINKSSVLVLDYDDDIFNFELIGLQTVKTEDYKISLAFNTILNFKFKRKQDFSVIQKEGEFHFSIYQFYDEKIDINYTLFSNLSLPKEIKLEDQLLFGTAVTHTYLFSELKKYNYLLKAESKFNNNISLDLQKLKLIIQHQFIYFKKLKNKENLILNL